jgi:hypothetical protein
MDLDFYGLVRPVQERFIASARGQAVPAPLAIQRATLTSTRPWLAMSAVALVALCAVAMLGFGNLDSSLAIGSVVQLALYVVLLAVAAGCLLRALALQHRFRSLPFPPGNYLFPIGVIEARSAALRLHSLLDLESVQVNHKVVVRIAFSGNSVFEFKARGEPEAEQVRQIVLEAKKTLQLAEETGNRRELARLDPLRDNGFSNPFGPTGAFRQRTPAWAKTWIAIALLIGAGGGYCLWKGRNLLSEARLYQAAASKNTVEAFQAYLARTAGSGRSEVKETLLPRAELKRAEAQGTVEAIEKYISQHSSTKIAAEVERALRSTLLTALEQAKAQGTLSAIRNLRTQYKNTKPIEEEIAQAEHELFVRVFEEYKAQAPAGEKVDPVPFFQRLFDYLERHGPKIEVRWRRQLRDSVRQADNQVKLSAYFMGVQSVPSQYYDEARSRKREAVATEKLLALLQPRFPAEVLRLEAGTPFDPPVVEPGPEASDGPLPNVSVPTLLITHTTEMTGGYMSQNPRGIFVGVSLFYTVVFSIPGDQEPLRFRFSVWRPPNLQLLKQEHLSTEAMYDLMTDSAFALFVDRYAATLIKPPPADSASPQ